ncbi:MAG: site-specific DNA-methyltransferase [Bacillota bacterium]
MGRDDQDQVSARAAASKAAADGTQDEVQAQLATFFAHYPLDGDAPPLSGATFHVHPAVGNGGGARDLLIYDDLGGFLRRELDRYIKDEVVRLDDLASVSASEAARLLNAALAVRREAEPAIASLAAREEDRKHAWLAKPRVAETHWCVTLDRVPPDLYPAVAANEAQRREWVRLFHIDEDIAGPADAGPLFDGLGGAVYTERLTVEFLKAHPSLVVDTAFFDADFEARLVASLGGPDAAADGLLIKGENFQALNYLADEYRGRVSCAYIDPPYNTGGGDFTYRDDYRRSVWTAMMRDRLALARDLLSPDGSLVCHIDEHEFAALQGLLDEVFGPDRNIGPIIWDKRNPKGDRRGIATQHEYIAWAVKNERVLEARNLQRPKEHAAAILAKAAELLRAAGGVAPEARQAFRRWVRRQEFSGGETAYCELDDHGRVYRAVSMAWPNKKRPPDEYFEPLIHPVTGKPCPVPARGWRNPPGTMRQLLAAGLILFGPDETTQPTRKYYLADNLTENVPSLLYFGGSDDALFAQMGLAFENPKPLKVATYLIGVAGRGPDALVLDFFAGSGTTGQAVIELNRADGGHRKYVLVEAGEHFDTVLKPRLLKAFYSREWRDGRPASREGVSHVLKYIRLESYEDAPAASDPLS